ncbi:MAG: helix-turn-helix transcriptional regulator [Anaerolineaceae bacterium]|nr:helix-turn-helix transcriptional regulator [Anaerolineaceae bacterium]
MNEIVYASRHSMTWNVSKHMHNTWELIYYTSGNGIMVFNGYEISYKEGDVIAVPPNTPHSNHSENGFTNIFLNLAESSLNIKNPIKIQDDPRHFILNAFSAAYYHFNEDADSDKLLTAYGYLIVHYILSYQESPIYSEIVDEIRGNIVQNFSDSSYELDKFLRSLPFSYDYLRKLFKKETGVTPHQFLCDKRLNTAAEYLASIYNDGSNIADIARQCGFDEPLYFSRMFKKKFGTAPSFYRTDKQKNVKRLEPEEVRVGNFSPESA